MIHYKLHHKGYTTVSMVYTLVKLTSQQCNVTPMRSSQQLISI